MRGVRPAPRAELLQLEPLAALLLVAGRAVVTPLALGTRQGNDVPHSLVLALQISGFHIAGLTSA